MRVWRSHPHLHLLPIASRVFPTCASKTDLGNTRDRMSGVPDLRKRKPISGRPEMGGEEGRMALYEPASQDEGEDMMSRAFRTDFNPPDIML